MGLTLNASNGVRPLTEAEKAAVRKDLDVVGYVNGSLVSGDGSGLFVGPITAGVWFRVQAAPRLRVTGTGTVTVDTRDAAGNVQTAAYVFNASGTPSIEWPYPGDSGTHIRVSFTGSAAAEVL